MSKSRPLITHHSLLKERLAGRLSLTEAVDGLITIVKSAVGFVNRGSDFSGGGLQAGGSAGLRFEVGDLRFNLLSMLDQRQVEAIDGVELRLLDLLHIEEACVAVGRKPYTVFELVEFLEGRINRLHFKEPPAVCQLAHHVVERFFGAAQAVGQLLAVALVHVAARLAVNVAAVAGNLAGQSL